MSTRTGITAISRHLSDRTTEVFEISRPIPIIPNFVNCDLYRPDPEKKVGNGTAKTLIHISNFRNVKRPTDCIHILHRVRREIPPAFSWSETALRVVRPGTWPLSSA